MSDDNTAYVEIGAKIDKLIEGVDSVKDHLESLRGTAESMSDGFSKIRETLIEVFSVEAILHFIEAMGELGLQTERTMAMLGITSKSVGELSGIAKLTGTSVEGLTSGLERMSLNIQRSTTDALGPQAQALKVLGLNAKELIGLPADQYFLKLADAVSKFNPSLNLTNAVMAVGGRGVAQLIPMLELGAKGYEEFRAAVDATGSTLTEKQTKAFAEAHQQMTLLGLSMQGLGNRIFTVLQPAIIAVTKYLTQFVQSIDAQKIQAAMTIVVDTVVNAIVALGVFFQNFTEAIEVSIKKLKEWASTIALVAKIMQLPFTGGAGVASLFGGAIDDQVKDAEKREPEWAARLRKIAADLKAEMQGAFTDDKSDKPGNKVDIAALNEAERQKLEATVARIQGQIKLEQDKLAQLKLIYSADAAQHNITEQQKFQLTMTATANEYNAERDNLQKIRDLWPPHTKEWEAANAKMLESSQKFYAENLKLNADSIKQQQTTWNGYFTDITSAFNSQLKGLLSGTTTFAQAFKNILGDLVIRFIEAVEKMAVQWAAGQLAQLTATQTTETGKVAAEAAATQASLGLKMETFLADIAANVARVFSGVAAFLAPALGPAAPGVAAGVAASVSAAAIAAVPAAETGAWDVKPGLFMLHAGEKVLPAGAAKVFGDMADGKMPGGGSGNHFHFDTIDPASFMNWARQNAKALANVVSDHIAYNPPRRAT